MKCQVRHIFKINILYIKSSMLQTNTKYLLHKNLVTDKLPICKLGKSTNLFHN